MSRLLNPIVAGCITAAVILTSSPARAQDLSSIVAKARSQVENGDYQKSVQTLALLRGRDLPPAVAIEAGLLNTSAALVLEGEAAAAVQCEAAIEAAGYNPDVAQDFSPKVRDACSKAATKLRAKRAATIEITAFEVAAPKVAYQPIRVVASTSQSPEWLRLVARVNSSELEGTLDLPLVATAEGERRATMDAAWIRPGIKLEIELVVRDSHGDLGGTSGRKESLVVPRAEAMIALGNVPDGAVVSVDGDRARVEPGGYVPVEPGEHSVQLTLSDGRASSAEVDVARGSIARVALVPQESNTAGTIGWVLAGTSVALLGVGTAMLVVADNRRSELEDAAAEREPGTSLPANEYSELEDIESERGTFQTLGTVFLIAGGVTAVAAVTLWLWPSSSGGSDSALMVRPIIGPAYVGAMGHF